MADFTYFHPHAFSLEAGGELPSFELAYATFGQLNESKDNVVWVWHAFTGSQHELEWWAQLFGEGKFFDPNKHFIICANMLGSCYGSTGPLSTNPLTQQAYFHDFPLLTNKDIVRDFDLLRINIGIERVNVEIGGSMRGQHVVEWAIYQPNVFEFIVPIAANALHSPWGIAFNETQRMAIDADSSWQTKSEEAGLEGMKAARAIAMHSYRSYEGYHIRQSEDNHDKFDSFKASSYQRYMGEKLSQRFNAFTYWYLSKAMDSHNVARTKGSMEKALEEIKAVTLSIALVGDLLFPPKEQKFIADHVAKGYYFEVVSLFGHDGFLVEKESFEQIFRKFLAKDTQMLKK